MKRGEPLKRKMPLNGGATIKRVTPLQQRRSTRPPKPPSKRQGRTEFEALDYRELAARVRWRDGGCVAVDLVPSVRCYGEPQVHHLWRRSQGGPDVEWNLKTLCAAHHTWVHEHVKEALALDLLRRRGQRAPTS